MPEYSYWIIFGLILIIGEFVVSGLVLIFLGLAAVIVGGLAYFGLINDLTWEITLFAVLSLALLAGARRFLRDWLFGKETQGRTSDDSAGWAGVPPSRRTSSTVSARCATGAPAGRRNRTSL